MDPLQNGGQTPGLTVSDAVATVTLRRPAKLNRLTLEDLNMLQAHCDRLERDEAVRVVVLTAETFDQKEPVFSAGYDIGGFDAQAHDPNLFENTVERIARLPQVVIAGLNGSVYGGATDLILACDLRIALAGSQFRMPACALGLHYYPSGLQRFVQVLGLEGARQVFLTATALPVERLEHWGAFLAVYPTDKFQGALAELAQHVAQLAPLATRATKASLNDIARGDASLQALRSREALCLASADFIEGRQAFAQRRTPQFSGR